MAKLASVVLVFAMAGIAVADEIDFRPNAPWESGDGSASFTPAAQPLSWVDVSLIAHPAGATLWHDSTDGVAVRFDYENDEVEGAELLQVRFSEAVYISRIYVTDLFWEGSGEDGNTGLPSDPGAMYLEQGTFQTEAFDGAGLSAETHFLADPGQVPTSWSNGTNGERWVDVNAVAQSIYLSAPGLVNGQNHEFALGKIEVTAVPEPGTLALLGVGVAGLGYMRRRRLRKS